MYCEFYADVFFLTNCCLDFAAVYAVSEILQQKKRLLRFLLGCALSSAAGCALFLSTDNYYVYLLYVHFLINPGMVLFCFFPAESKVYGKAFCLMYFVILLLGGSMEWLYVTVAGRRYYELCLLASIAPVALFLFILRRRKKKVQRFYRVMVRQGDERARLTALYDTGNGLLDPYIKEPVHIVSKEAVWTFVRHGASSFRLIPFSSVGCEDGMLKAFTVDGIRIEEGDKAYEISPAVLALAEETLFLGRPYQMILNCKSFERKEEKICT